jgi:hypothetical protein
MYVNQAFSPRNGSFYRKRREFAAAHTNRTQTLQAGSASDAQNSVVKLGRARLPSVAPSANA